MISKWIVLFCTLFTLESVCGCTAPNKYEGSKENFELISKHALNSVDVFQGVDLRLFDYTVVASIFNELKGIESDAELDQFIERIDFGPRSFSDFVSYVEAIELEESVQCTLRSQVGSECYLRDYSVREVKILNLAQFDFITSIIAKCSRLGCNSRNISKYQEIWQFSRFQRIRDDHEFLRRSSYNVKRVCEPGSCYDDDLLTLFEDEEIILKSIQVSLAVEIFLNGGENTNFCSSTKHQTSHSIVPSNHEYSEFVKRMFSENCN